MPQKSNRKLWTDFVQKQASKSAQVQESIHVGSPFKGVVLGIDPSLRGSGFSLIEYSSGRAYLMDRATLKVSNKFSMVDCLGKIGNQVASFLEHTRVDHVAIEQTIYVQNFQTAQILGAARGAAIAPAATGGMKLFHINTPNTAYIASVPATLTPK